MRLKTLSILTVAMAALLILASASFAADPVIVSGENAANVAATQSETAIRHGVAAEPAGEEGGGDVTAKEISPGTLIVTILIFLCLLAVLSKTAWKPIMTGLKGRELAIRESIEAAERAKAEAERSTRELEARMAEVQRQGAQQLTQAKADALKLAESIRAQAETDAAALKDRTLREIEGAKQQALSEINTHAATLGMAVARKILQRNVTVDDQQRLVDESLAEIARTN